MSGESREALAAFREEHCAVLALLAHAARQCVDTRMGEAVFEALCSAEPALAQLYPEVALLYNIHQVRRALRDRQTCPPESMVSLCDTLCTALRGMYDVLPDLLLLVVAEAAEVLQQRNPSCHALELSILNLVENIQSVLLQETMSLQRRGASITLRLRDIPPFVV
ncbi:uncharacterized protein Tco025E_01807 [Trypanosoma conorhini]|uniref:Uncharacterized protein n=1 Tax=Trypanosoma conorhini TaxID=83891 RepID=A0A3R7NRG2_9TRYP|nr:uncharacterized protein Tco025E_01807 [Trypanosoma conorhini]RNF25921.1 hypothetical protein Tco025E_01807 [Trypanosoma conorhini]